MLQLFRDRRREEDGWRVWWDVVCELLTSLPREHWHAHARELGIVGTTLAVISLVLWIVLLTGPQLAYLPLADVPSVVGEWTQHYDFPVTESTFTTLGTRDILNRLYTGKRQSVALFVARWASNRFVTSHHEPEMNGWQVRREETTVIPVAGDTSFARHA